MRHYRLVDNALGWLAFLIAAIVYCSTIEPTASFWDCPEFITTGYKLEIGHPPGAPFFMLTANLFSQFVSNPSDVARMVNTMSALLSATTIMFLFWSITHLTRKLILKDWSQLTLAKWIIIEASGLVGALIYTFSDTFWFSAVEGEVYAYSSAFTAIVFWLILKWEDHADEPHSDRWLILITYMTGLSIGVHLLNLLCIPAIVLVFCYRKFPHIELKGSLIALLVSFAIVTAVLYGVVPGIITVGGWFELFFVNGLGCPFNTGEIIYILLLVATVLWAIYESYTDKSEKRSNISFVASVAMLGIPFYGYGWSAVLIGIVVLAILWFALNYKHTVDKKKVSYVTSRIKNTTLLCLLMLMIGYSSYAVIVIRSVANPPMDQNSPEDIFTLGSYLSRDQYGQRPLFKGEAFTSYDQAIYAQAITIDESNVWQPKTKEQPNAPDEYESVVASQKLVYPSGLTMFFPRIWDYHHAQAYQDWMGGDIAMHDVTFTTPSGQEFPGQMPTQWSNFRFFTSYQLNFMYWRYFLWNFAGRQNGVQSFGQKEYGNYLTGLPVIDNFLYGDQSKLPDVLKEDKSHNVFYCLPLLLGLLGLFWQLFRGEKGVRQFWVVFFLFFMTGLAIILYLNQTPQQPRERDYAYAGSFYAFAIWIGLGVAAIYDWIKRFWVKQQESKAMPAAIFASVLGIIVPLQMVSQTWDDHDRSGRYLCHDSGLNYLNTMPEKLLDGSPAHPIFFCNGDNDTFPLWYAQEVEGIRTDVRVCNTSYLQTDWYTDQMKRQAYNSDPLPITWTRAQYIQGTRDHAYLIKRVEQMDLNQALEWLRSDDPRTKTVPGVNEPIDYLPAEKFVYPIDSNAVRQNNAIDPQDAPMMARELLIDLSGKQAIGKEAITILDMVVTNNWKRPIYFAITVDPNQFVRLDPYFQKTGLAYRLVPFSTRAEGARPINTEKMYDNVMNRFKWGGADKPGVYLEENTMRMCKSYRMYVFGELAQALIREGKRDKALAVADKAMKVLPAFNVPLDYSAIAIGEVYMALGEKAKGEPILDAIVENSLRNIRWYVRLKPAQFASIREDLQRDMAIVQNVIGVGKHYDPNYGAKYVDEFTKFYNTLAPQLGNKQ